MSIKFQLQLGLSFTSILLASCADTNTSELGLVQLEVVGGEEATQGAWPWQAQLAVPEYPHWCGGSLIAPNWVLTAGHCLKLGNHDLDAEDFQVTLGEHDITVSEGEEQVRSVVEIVPHDDYAGALFNDIALLKLDSPVELNAFVDTVRLAVTGDESGQDGTMAGWGDTSFGSESSNVLLEAVLPVVAVSACNSDPNLVRDLQFNEMCAGFVGGDRSACEGDSGGPLVVQRSGGGWEQVGIVSWGYACESHTVFSRVTSHASWIRRRVLDPALFVAIAG